MFKKRVETPMDTTATATINTTATTPSTVKSKKFPAMFKKMMLSSSLNNF